MAERVGYVRIKPRRNAPGTYLTLNIKFVQGAWYELPETILHPDTGEPFPILERLSRITDTEERPVFDVLPYSEARAVQEKEQSAELERLLAARAVVAPGMADVDRPVRPTVQVPAPAPTPPAPPAPASPDPRASAEGTAAKTDAPPPAEPAKPETKPEAKPARGR